MTPHPKSITIDGQHFIEHLVNPSARRIEAYKQARLRFKLRLLTNTRWSRINQLYIHINDQEDAQKIDDALRWVSSKKDTVDGA